MPLDKDKYGSHAPFHCPNGISLNALRIAFKKGKGVGFESE